MISNVHQIMAFEEGQLGVRETLELFCDLGNSGTVWKLQGFYGRTMMGLINQGLIVKANDGQLEIDEEVLQLFELENPDVCADNG